MSEPLLTVAEAAAILRLGRSTLYRLVEDGEIETVRIGRAVRFEATAVDDFIQRNRTSQRGPLRAVGGTRDGAA